MGIQAPTGVSCIAPVPQGDQANQELAGSFSAVGTSLPVNPFGPWNLLIWAEETDALTVTAASTAFSLGTGTGVAPGTAVKSTLVPPGTTVATYNSGAKTGTFAFPKRQLAGIVNASNASVSGIADTSYLLGAAVSGTGIPAGATVLSIPVPSIAPTAASPGQTGTIILSARPTIASPAQASPIPGTILTFALAAAGAVGASGSDTAALLDGYGIVYSATVQLERSFDGGAKWLLANIGGQGTPAQWTNGTPVSAIVAEPERGVLYRLNCAAYTSGTINYRFSATGQAAMSISIPSAI